MKRREFVRTTTMGAPLLSLFPAGLSGLARLSVPGKIEKRALGRTGEMLSMLGFGGVVVMNETPEEASALVKMAVGSGINYFDVAPTYGDAEKKLGPALEPYRKEVFLACKTTERTREGARKELEQSLKNLRTDHFDLYQHHAVTLMEDVDRLLGAGGAMETFLEARREGKVRFIGFTAHSVQAALALIDRFDFDTILFPFNYATWYAGNFGPQVMERAHQKKMGILALKAMAKGPWKDGADRSKYPKCWYEPLSTTDEIRMGLRFALSHPVTAVVPSGQTELYKLVLEMRNDLDPLNDGEIAEIRKKGLAGVPLFRNEDS